MDFICSLTGKSPSTTGFGSEGALTKRPFNALSPVVDLNNALVSSILTGYAGFTTSAGYVGPQYPRGSRHQPAGAGDLVPHARARARSGVPDRRTDTSKRSRISASTAAPCWPAGWATASRRSSSTASWAASSRRPDAVFHGGDAAAGEAGHGAVRRRRGRHRRGAARVALHYFEDGSVRGGLPAAQGAAAHHGARRATEGQGVEDADVRGLFTREYLMASDWYADRLRAKQARDVALWTRHLQRAAALPGRRRPAPRRRSGGAPGRGAPPTGARQRRLPT